MYTGCGNVKCIVPKENSMRVPQKMKNGIIMWPSNSASGYVSKKLKAGSWRDIAHARHRSISHNSQDVEATQVPTGGGMDKCDTVYADGGISVGLQQEGNAGHLGGTASSAPDPWFCFQSGPGPMPGSALGAESAWFSLSPSAPSYPLLSFFLSNKLINL